MPAPLRHVRQLRLKCARNEHARHGQILLEDALRTASLHDEGRLVIVKRLNLGAFSIRSSATHWSRRIEETALAQTPQQVTYEHPAEDPVAIVSFSSPLEPWLILARSILAGQRCTQWYWHSALPGWSPAMPAPDALRLCFKTLAKNGGLAATLHLARQLKTANSLPILLNALTESDLAPLKTDLLAVPNSVAVSTSLPTLAEAFTAPRLSSLELTFLRANGPFTLRSAWLAAARLVQNYASSPFSIPSAVSPTRINQVLQHWQSAIVAARAHPLTEAPPAIPPLAAKSTVKPEDAQQNRSSSEVVKDVPSPKPEPTDLLPERSFTNAGGLFFLIPLLQRAGLPETLSTFPDEHRDCFPWQILETALRHARIEQPDPLATALSALPASPNPAGLWLQRTNRLALALAKMNLRQIIRRPALITLSPQQIDLFFRANEADPRLRRTGLDLDPGWVPWLQRVVRYHFNRED